MMTFRVEDATAVDITIIDEVENLLY
ncbi:hypothetical protein SY1_05390 [Fretibacterium fastidiosum]|uniref:Uncharacterized protein n=1 Tax=Fretibacterium fastidiosum TaxID=651822 RepID=A0AB94IW26_9BACT|nr:hypothetical protein SY1_05390 [Fretibacterium fastidiosum]